MKWKWGSPTKSVHPISTGTPGVHVQGVLFFCTDFSNGHFWFKARFCWMLLTSAATCVPKC